ncbi:MAG TPA: elongation factor P, partial [Clostridiaceae bacterium]|nr:elongation factor P [Clostridiaceae bacterium]
FMDTETYDQLPFTAEMIGDGLNFLKENMVCKVVSYKGTVFSVELPLFVELLITHTEPGVKGDTATNATKTAEVETGATIKVPLFINEGEKVRIDTRTGEYMERVKE